jgi:hypothetical protein
VSDEALLIEVLLVWLLGSGLILWPLAWWSGKKERHLAVLFGSILMALFFVAPLTPWHSVANRWSPEFVLLLPFVSCIAFGQVAIRVRFAPVYACWCSWGIGVLIAFVAPLMYIAVSCDVRGECITRTMPRHGCGYELANAGQDTRALQRRLEHGNIT